MALERSCLHDLVSPGRSGGNASTGAASSGGKGSLVGTVLGILILGMTAKGLRLMGVNTNMQLMVTGSIMILAVFMHSFHDRISIFTKR